MSSDTNWLRWIIIDFPPLISGLAQAILGFMTYNIGALVGLNISVLAFMGGVGFSIIVGAAIAKWVVPFL